VGNGVMWLHTPHKSLISSVIISPVHRSSSIPRDTMHNVTCHGRLEGIPRILLASIGTNFIPGSSSGCVFMQGRVARLRPGNPEFNLLPEFVPSSVRGTTKQTNQVGNSMHMRGTLERADSEPPEPGRFLMWASQPPIYTTSG
jgi:hypothetical protein